MKAKEIVKWASSLDPEEEVYIEDPGLLQMIEDHNRDLVETQEQNNDWTARADY